MFWRSADHSNTVRHRCQEQPFDGLLDSTTLQVCVLHQPMKSASSRGPMGWLVPSRMPLSMSCAEATPSMSAKNACEAEDNLP